MRYALAVSYLFLVAVDCLTKQEEATIRGYINKAIIENTGGNARGPQVNVPGFVRLSFHDCVGGTCDGCINLNDAENKGLGGFINTLEAIYVDNGLNKLVSRADLWALAGAEAVLYGAKSVGCRPGSITQCRRHVKRPIPPVIFRYGRKDCPTSPKTTTHRSHPTAHDDLTGIRANFRMNFPEVTDREMVALMGAHTLGFAKPPNLGWVGRWDAHPNWLDNEFFRDMVNSQFNWTQVDVRSRRPRAPRRYEYVRGTDVNKFPPSFVMLNSDMCLFKEFDVDSNGKSNCPIANSCQEASTAGVVREYAADNEKWIREFGPTFTKMIENGYRSGSLKTPM